MALGGAYQSLISIVDTWKDDSLDTGEQILQTIMSLGSVILSLVPVFQASFKMIQTSGEIAGHGIQRAFGWISLVLSILSIVVSVVMMIVKAIPKEETAAEKAGKALESAKSAAEDAKKAVKELKEEYADLLASISKYEEASLAIDKMRVGTEEWKKAVEDLNNQVLTLMEEYPELVKYVTTDKNGVMSISQEGLDLVQKNKQQEINEAQSFATYTQQKVLIRENQLATEESDNAEKYSTLANRMYFSDISDEEKKAVYDIFGVNDQSGLLGRGATGFDNLNKKSVAELQALKDSILESSEVYGTLKSPLLDLIDSQMALKGSIEDNNTLIQQQNMLEWEKEAQEKGYDAKTYSILKQQAVTKDSKAKDTVVYNDFDDYLNKTGYKTAKDKGYSVNGDWVNLKYRANSASEFTAIQTMVNDFAKSAGVEGTVAYNEISKSFDKVKYDNYGTVEFKIGDETYTLNELTDMIANKKNQANQDAANKLQEETLNDLIAKGYNQTAAHFLNGNDASLYGDYWTAGELSTIATYDLGDDYKASVNDYLDDFYDEANKIIENTGFDATKTMFSNFTQDDYKTFANNIEKASLMGGGDAVKDIFEQYANDPEATAFINEALAKVNWSDSTSVQEFIASLAEQGYTISENNVAWQSFMDVVNNGTRKWIQNSQKVIDNLNTVKSIAGDISVGDIISDEDYKKLLTISPEVEKLFIKTAEGYKALFSGDYIENLVKSQYKDLKGIKQLYDDIQTTITNSGVEGQAGGITTYEAAGTLLSNFSDNEQFLSLLGITPEALASWQEKAAAGDANAQTLIKNAGAQANQLILDAQNGEFNSKQAQELWATTFAESWSEVKEAIENGELDSDVADKAELSWKNTYLSEGGYANFTTSKSADELEGWIERVRQLEFDYLKKINFEIEQMGVLLDKAFGSEKQKLLEENIALQAENVAATEGRNDIAQEKLETEGDFLIETFGSSILDAAGNISLTALGEVYKTLDEDQRAYIDTYLATIDMANDAALEMQQAYWGIIDAQLESIKYQEELQNKIKEAQLEWLEFGQKFAGYASGDLDVFGEKSAADIINDSFERYYQKEGAFSFNNLDFFNADAVASVDKVRQGTELRKSLETENEGLDNLIVAANARIAENNKNLYKTETVTEFVGNRPRSQAELQEAMWAEVEEASANIDRSALHAAYNAVPKEIISALETGLTDAELEGMFLSYGGRKEFQAWEKESDRVMALESDALNAALEKYGYEDEGSILIDPEAGREVTKEIQVLDPEVEKAIKNDQRAIDYWEKQRSDNDGKLSEMDSEYAQYFDAFANNPYATMTEDGKVLFDEAAFEADWANALDTTKSQLEDLQAELQSLYDGYLQAQDELMALYDTEIEKLSTINGILQSSAELWKLVGKNSQNFSAQLNGYYEKASENSKMSYDLAYQKLGVAQTEYVKVLSLGDKASKEMIETATNNLSAATQAITESASAMLDAVAQEFSSKMSTAIDDAIKVAFEGKDLAAITEEWQLESANDERYLDDINAAYGISNLERSFQKSIDATDSLSAQKKLRDVMEEQLAILEDKDKLSQYDLDRANAMYDLTLKQIALEEAQQTASKMKLTRDASGNYSYQYVADEDAIAKAEEELAAAENNLYNMDKDRTKELVDEYYSTMTEANEAIAEAMAAGDADRVERLRSYYFDDNGLISSIQKEIGASSENLDAIGEAISGTNWDSGLAKFTDAISGMNLTGEDGLFTNISNVLNDAVGENGALTNVVSTINGLLGNEDSLLNASLGLLTTSVNSADSLLDETATLMTATESVLAQLPGLTEVAGALATQLETYSKQYTDYLNSQKDVTQDATTQKLIDETKKNSEVISDLTETLKNKQNVLSYMDGIDGTMGNLEGWTLGSDGIYTQNVNED